LKRFSNNVEGGEQEAGSGERKDFDRINRIGRINRIKSGERKDFGSCFTLN
jgi:hypothetical protein